MARFRHRESGAPVSATRLSSPKEIEAQGRGWITAGAGNWEVVDPIPGTRHVVLEDHEFRATYEATDTNARKALEAAAPGTMRQTAQDAPAPPEHTAAQSLPAPKTARQAAKERGGA